MSKRSFNRFVDSIRQSPAAVLTNRASELTDSGADVVCMCREAPDFRLPDHVRAAAIEVIEDTSIECDARVEIVELRAAIVEKMRRENGLEYHPSEILVTSGGKQACSTAIAALVDIGDEVIIPAPYWSSYPGMVRLVGGEAVVLPTSRRTELKITPTQLRESITSKTKLVILNSPANPSGAVYTVDELEEIAEVLRESDVFILSDDVYERFVYEGEFANILTAAPDLRDRTIVVNSMSKSYGMAGWHVGWAAGPPEVIRAMTKIREHQTTKPSIFGQRAALAALTGSQDFLVEWREEYRARRDYTCERLSNMPWIVCPGLLGAFFAFPDISSILGKSVGDRLIDDDIAFCTYLLEEHGVSTMPGSAYGLPGYLRLSYACDKERLADALDRIEAGLTALT